MMGITICSEESGRTTRVNFNFTDSQNQKMPNNFIGRRVNLNPGNSDQEEATRNLITPKDSQT